MIEIGYALSSEEHPVDALIKNASHAEDVGFSFSLISDHYHPWISAQGESPFVWAVLGGIATQTTRLKVGTGVTCPIMRIHPAVIAQAAATVSAMMPGRFFLGLGTGEYLNEHIFGDPWPDVDARQEMLEETIDIIRQLWEGEEITFEGTYFSVSEARIYTLPKGPTPIYLAASGPETAEIAGSISDGLITTNPKGNLVRSFSANGGKGKPAIAQMKVAWATNRESARRVVEKWWPTSTLSGRLKVDLPTPGHFEDVVAAMDRPAVSDDIVLGPKVDDYLDAIQKISEAGYNHVYIHQVGPDQADFFDFFKTKLRPELEQENMIAVLTFRWRKRRSNQR